MRPNAVIVPRDMPGPVVQYFRKRIKAGDTDQPNGLQIGTLPAGAILMPAITKVVAPFAGGTAAVINAGTDASNINIVAAADLVEGDPAGTTRTAAAVPVLNFAVPTPIYVRYTLGGSTSGEAVIVIPYIADDDQ